MICPREPCFCDQNLAVFTALELNHELRKSMKVMRYGGLVVVDSNRPYYYLQDAIGNSLAADSVGLFFVQWADNCQVTKLVLEYAMNNQPSSLPSDANRERQKLIAIFYERFKRENPPFTATMLLQGNWTP